MSCTIPKSYKGEIRVHAIPAPLLRARVCDGSPHAGPAGSTAVPGLGASCFFFGLFSVGRLFVDVVPAGGLSPLTLDSWLQSLDWPRSVGGW